MTQAGREHYSYRVYADPKTARTFDDRRFGGPIGELIAGEQARVLATQMRQRFEDRDKGAFYFTAAGAADLIVRDVALGFEDAQHGLDGVVRDGVFARQRRDDLAHCRALFLPEHVHEPAFAIGQRGNACGP